LLRSPEILKLITKSSVAMLEKRRLKEKSE